VALQFQQRPKVLGRIKQIATVTTSFVATALLRTLVVLILIITLILWLLNLTLTSHQLSLDPLCERHGSKKRGTQRNIAISSNIFNIQIM
jgi:hypothetical protein